MLRAQLEREIRKVKSGLVHDVKFVVSPASLGSSAAALNEAYAGTFKKKFQVQIQNTEGLILDYFDGFNLDVSGVKNVSNVNVGNPTFTNATPPVNKGIAIFEAIYDTGAGKTYATADRVVFTVAAKTGTILVSFSPAAATVTDTIVA